MADPLRILFVEDSPDDAQLLMLQLERDGIEATYQRVDSEAAFKAALDSTPDLILSDFSMPRFNGLRALKILKERGLDIPFILISGTVGEDVAVDAIKQGADDYLMKDRPARLSAAIKSALEQKRLRDERARAEESLLESEERYRTLAEASRDMISLLDADGQIKYVNQVAAMQFDVTPHELVGRNIAEIFPPQIAARQQANLQKALETGESLYVEAPANFRGGEVWLGSWLTPIQAEQGEAKTVLVVSRNITERKQAEEKIGRQVDYLTAMREIDRTIASTFDMRLSLDSLLTKAVTLLAVDAADILLVNSTLNTLNYAAGRGFRTYAAETADVKLGQSYAGRAALERRLIQIPNLVAEPGNPLLTQLLKGEGFVSYHGVPLVVKGKVIGVLEIFNRSFVKRDQEWFDFLDTLSGQAAIAIDNAQSFANMQSSNTELIIAYDATIEGWSRAMDLRDRETEGHTQRVTGLTLDLARALDIPQAEMIHIRRGALLHDMGKLGVPDSILHKPEQLTDEEWVVMRQHPAYAFDMLTPIAYLRPALDIPYCHHEKWDGSGYPRGLKGEQIPLAARLFAVVDVWDALRSDRPYRAQWSREKTIEYIKEQSGKHFDPKVVEAFLALIQKEM